MERVLPESVQTLHLSGPLTIHELQQLFDQAPFGIAMFDREFRCREVNASFAQLSGLARSDHPGKTLFEISPARAPMLAPLLQQLLHGAQRVELELDDTGAPHPASSTRWHLSCGPVLDDDGIFNGLFLITRDLPLMPAAHPTLAVSAPELSGHQVQQLSQMEARLQHLSYHDPLTDLGNRSLLQERLTLEIEMARLNRHTLALLFIDLDGFKLINDNLGQSAGDQLLKLSADRIRHCLRTGTSPSGWGPTSFWCCSPTWGNGKSWCG